MFRMIAFRTTSLRPENRNSEQFYSIWSHFEVYLFIQNVQVVQTFRCYGKLFGKLKKKMKTSQILIKKIFLNQCKLKVKHL